VNGGASPAGPGTDNQFDGGDADMKNSMDVMANIEAGLASPTASESEAEDVTWEKYKRYTITVTTATAAFKARSTKKEACISICFWLFFGPGRLGAVTHP
jgi:hypothetical protein